MHYIFNYIFQIWVHNTLMSVLWKSKDLTLKKKEKKIGDFHFRIVM